MAPDATATLTAKQEKAALLVAEDEQTDVAIARTCGIGRRTLARWKDDPDFKAAVAAHITRLGQELSRYAIARKDRRVAALNDRWNRLQLIADEWAEHGLTDRRGNPVPGSSTGYQRQQATATKAGMVYEYAADTGLSAELRALEKQAAQEVGQWAERQTTELSGTINIANSWTELVKELEHDNEGGPAQADSPQP